MERSLCSKWGEELLNDVGGREFGFDILQRVFLNTFDSKLSGTSGPRTMDT